MGEISIRILRGLDPTSGPYPSGAGNVIGSIRRLYRGRRAPGPGRPVLVSVGGIPTRARLPAGRYIVDATLPSGELATQVVDVPKAGLVDVSLDAGHSPREWLSWQDLAGHVGIEDLGSVEIPRESMGLVAPQIPWMIRQRVRAHPRGDPLASPVNDRAGQFDRFSLDSFEALHGGQRRTFNRDGPYDSFLLRSSDEPGVRWFIDVESGFGSNVLAVVPMPWMQSKSLAPVDIDVLITRAGVVRDGADETPIEPDCSIVVRDPVMSTVIAYLAGGSLVAARGVLREAEILLFLKRQNAIAAAAGGYVLLATDQTRDSQQRPHWYPWIENLADWFPWLPDGAIQRAWLALKAPAWRRPREVRDLTLDGFQRGIPFYAAGVQMLRDALLVLAARDPEDMAIRRALTSTRRLALSVDPTRAFTTVRTSAADRYANWRSGKIVEAPSESVDRRASLEH